MGIGKVKAEDVTEAVKLGVNMQPFDVVYYPWVGTPKFFVKSSLIRTAFQIKWCSGMRFQMAIETKDPLMINWLMGTIASVETADPAWPDSPWRRLQVTWDLPDLMTNTKRLNHWQIEIFPAMSLPISLSPFLPQYLTFPNNFQTPNVPETSTASMQGARHDHFSHLENIPLDNPALQKESTSEKDSPSISISTQPSEKLDHAKPNQIVLLGQIIQIDSGNENAEKKITSSCSDPLQDLPKLSSGERLECDPESQCRKDTLPGETVEIED
ncbi:hypothetical protein KIW84_031663 [Lathyrus oleraceus]|nr:hypothetical protein KIW84_031663 [Pisum sativum]